MSKRYRSCSLLMAVCGFFLCMPAAAQSISKWVSSSSNPSPSTLFIGGGNLVAAGGYKEFVCRGTPPEGGTHPGRYVPVFGKCFIEFAGNEVGLTTFELLTDFSGIWVPASGGTIPQGAFVAGSEAGQSFFSCRVFFGGGMEIGKIRSDFKACNIGLNGAGTSISNYEVLVNPWIPSTGANVPGQLLTGTEAPPDSQQLFTCRAITSGGIHLGKFRQGLGCSIGVGNQGVQVNSFEILADTLTGVWRPAANGTIPAGAFHAGRESAVFLFDVQYPCRANQGGGVHPGKIVSGLGGCQIQFGAVNGQLQQVLVSNYEVLIPTPGMPSGPFKIHTKSTGKSWVEGSNLLITTLTQPDDATARYSAQPQAGGGFRVIVQADNKELHQDGGGDKALSTRFQPHDDFTVFLFEQQADIGSYRMRTKADNRYLSELASGAISASNQIDDDSARVFLEPVTAAAAAPAVTFSPSSLDFGAQAVGVASAAKTVILSNTGSAALSVTSVTGTAEFSVTHTCGAGVAAGSSCTLNITFRPAAAGVRTGTITVADNASGSPHTFTVSGTAGSAAWTITKTHSGSFTQGQNGATYTITASNSGTVATSGGIAQVFDTLPAGLTAVSIQGTGWLCAVGNLIGCNRGDSLAPGASYPPLTLTVNVAANAPASVTNQVSITGGNAGSATASDPTTINSSGSPAWTITKTHSGNFTQGQNGATYTITATNSGTAATSGGIAQVFDTLPAGLTAVSIQGTGWLCAVGNLIGCNRGDSLAPGASYPPLTLTVNVAANAPASVTNQVSISGGNAGSANATDPTTINPSGSPAWTVTKTHAGNFTQGQKGAAYTITVSNSGTVATSGGIAQVIDSLPAGLTAVSIQGAGWLCTVGPPSIGCNRDDSLAPGASYPPITLLVNVAANAPTSVINQVNVTGGSASAGFASDPTTITATALTLSPGSLPAATVNIAYSAQLTASGGTAPLTFSVTSGSLPSGLSLSFNGLLSGTPTQQGTANFTVQAKDAAAITGQASYSLTVSASSAPAITSVLNGSSFDPAQAISSGSWVSIFGTNLAPAGVARLWNASTEIVNGKFPLSLEGTSVTVNGKPAAVEYVQSSQVNIQMPDDSAVGPVQVVLTTASGSSNSFTVMLAQFAPGLFPAKAPYIVAQHADSSYVTSDAPAKPGEVIILWGTGFGPGTPAVPSGQVFSGSSRLDNNTTVTIGGQPAIVDFAGIVGAGLVQINVRIPIGLPNGDAPVVARVGGVATQTTGNMVPVKN